MIKVKNIVLFLSLFILTGCVSYYDKESFEKKEKSLVFFDIKEDTGSLNFELTKYGDDKEVIRSTHFGSVPRNPLSLKPGIYYVSYISLLTITDGVRNEMRWLPGPGLKDGVVQYAAFEVKKGGEVLNLGILHVGLDKVELEDNNTELVKKLENSVTNLSEFANRVKKEKLYIKGSRLIVDQYKNPKWISIEEINNKQKALMNELNSRLQNYGE